MSTSTNFDSAAGSNFSTSSTSLSSSSSYSCSPSFSSSSSSFSGDAGGPGSSSSSSKSSGLSSNASAAAEMASGNLAPRRCVTRRGPSIRTVPTSGTTDRYVFHSTDPPSIASSSSSSSTTSILVRGLLAPVLMRRLARNDDGLWSLDVAATATKATAAPMTTSTSVRAVSLTCTSSVSSGKNVRAPADVREMSARRAPAPVASAALVLDQMPTAAAS